MDTISSVDTFENISQRVVYRSHRQQLAALPPVLSAGYSSPQPDTVKSQQDLYAFFAGFYEKMYREPALFGLPVSPDDCITGDDKEITKRKAELNRKLEKPRAMIAAGIDFLMTAGREGVLAEQPGEPGPVLLHQTSSDPDAVKTWKKMKLFRQGLAEAGLAISENGQHVTLSSAQFPAMMPALKALSAACSQAENTHVGRFNFARCDFRALDPKYQPEALDLFRAFAPADFERVVRLHEFFTGLNYKPICAIYGNFDWLVQYQGRRQVKSSPLFQIEYSVRHKNPMQIGLKCASTDRISPLMQQQPRSLQEHFFSHTYTCNGDACGWCRNKSYLGPSTIELDGVKKTICWYMGPNVPCLDDNAIELIQQYTWLHEQLA